MSEFAIIFIVLAMVSVIGIVSVILPKYLNRHIIQINKKAKEYVRNRLQKRENYSLDNFFNELIITEESRSRAIIVLQKIASEMGVTVERLRPDDRLCDLLKVQQNELEIVDQETWKKAKLQEGFIVFIYEIMQVLEDSYNKKDWENKWLQIPKDRRPHNDEDWVDFILPMTLKELIVFFEK